MALVPGGEDDNVLILQAQAPVKTRVVVHRCAYLCASSGFRLRAILVLCFNRMPHELRRAGRSGG